jgi:hypothetical protein
LVEEVLALREAKEQEEKVFDERDQVMKNVIEEFTKQRADYKHIKKLTKDSRGIC